MHHNFQLWRQMAGCRASEAGELLQHHKTGPISLFLRNIAVYSSRSKREPGYIFSALFAYNLAKNEINMKQTQHYMLDRNAHKGGTNSTTAQSRALMMKRRNEA